MIPKHRREQQRTMVMCGDTCDSMRGKATMGQQHYIASQEGAGKTECQDKAMRQGQRQHDRAMRREQGDTMRARAMWQGYG